MFESIFQNMFGVENIYFLEKILRPILVYIFLVICLRVFGKRELAQLNPFDLVVLLSLSNTVQNAIIGNDNSLIGGLVGALALLLTNYLVVRLLFKHRRLDQIIEGKPTTLIENGQIKRKNLAKELMSEAELISIAHRQGFSSLKEVEKCVLEVNGTFSIEGKEPPMIEKQLADIKSQLADLQKQLSQMAERKA